jgi:hypothetical protein
MILPPRPENHPRPEPSRRALSPHPRRQCPQRQHFAPPPWDRLSPQWLQIEDTLPADHRARAIDEAVDRLDLTALFASYLGVGRRSWPNAGLHHLCRLSRTSGRLSGRGRWQE